MFLFSYLFNTRQFVGLIIAVLLASSQADGTHNNRRSTKPGPLTTKNCDLTVSSHIRDLCKAYYSSDCQDATTEAPAAPLVYDCAIPSRLVDPLFNSETMAFASTVLKLYANSISPKPTANEAFIDSSLEVMQLLCNQIYLLNGGGNCEFRLNFTKRIKVNDDYNSDCGSLFHLSSEKIKEFYRPECMVNQIQKAITTCSALYDNGCLTGSAFNPACVKKLAGKQLD